MRGVVFLDEAKASIRTAGVREMRLEFLMEVGFIFRGGEKGKRIAGGADSKYSTKNLNEKANPPAMLGRIE